MTIRVLHLIKGLGPGGAEQLLVSQARATSSRDVNFSVGYLVTWKNHLVATLNQSGWATHCLTSDRVTDIRWLLRLRRLVKNDRIDVVHGHSPLVASLSRLVLRTIARKQRPRSVYTEHNEWGRHNRWTRRLNRWTIGLEDHLIAVSDAVKISMPSHLNIEVLIHGIDVDEVAAQGAQRDQVRGELGIGAHEIVIGTVANFRKEKAYDLLLDAAGAAIETNPRIRFVSVGQGPLEDDVRAQHKLLGLGDRFLLLGYRQDATRIMSAFDIFTLASHHEGLPVALMEAMALELPVIATSVGGIPSAVKGWPSIVIPPGDVDELVAAYGRSHDLLTTSRQSSESKRFDASESANRLMDIYQAT